MNFSEVFVILVVVAIAAFAVYQIRRKLRKKPLDTGARIRKIKDRSRVTHGGVKLWIEKGADVSTAESDAIDAGFLELFERATAAGYDRPLNLSDYAVAIMAGSIRAPESRMWCYKLPVGAYKGTQWDLGGYILAAGETVFYSGLDGEGNVIALPYYHNATSAEDLANLSRITGYEGEHVILFHCDPPRWNETSVHGVGQGHPLF